jgi:hypothetical protein
MHRRRIALQLDRTAPRLRAGDESLAGPKLRPGIGFTEQHQQRHLRGPAQRLELRKGF